MTTKILIIDDHPAIRHGLATLIQKEADLTVCGEAGNRREALEMVRQTPPDLVVLDLALQDNAPTGLDLISEIHMQVGSLPVLIYSMYDEMLYVERALQAGARGYLSKQEPIREITAAIRTVLNGEIYVSGAANQKLLSRHAGSAAESGAAENLIEQLSSREFEVFRLISMGHQPREIAKILNLSVKTVETHRMNIRKKLGLPDASALHLFAVEWGHRML